MTAAAEEAPPGLRSEYPFMLPRGYVDENGRLHRDGVMRLATAKDELSAHAEHQVRQDPAYLSVYLLARTVTTLGALSIVDRYVVENLFASDVAFLQDLYRRINQQGHTDADVACPECGHRFLVDVSGTLPEPS
jgi:hypothetical protein